MACLEDGLVPFRAFPQCLFRSLALGDVLDDAEHPHRLAFVVDLYAATAMEDELRSVSDADDPVIRVELPLFAAGFCLEAVEHRFAVIGVNDLEPVLDVSYEALVDAVDVVEYRRRRPHACSKVEHEVPDPCDAL